MEAEKPAGVVVLNGNTLDAKGSPVATGATSASAALVVRIGTCNTCGFNGYIGRVRNNVLIGGVAANTFGVYEDAPSGKTQHPDALENNQFWVQKSGTGGSALYRYYNGTAQTLLTTIAQVNGLNAQVPAMTVGANQSGDPLLDATSHLQAGSPCIDKGTATEAPPKDLDGENRPKGAAVDIGADEK
jgi:hypothetical protein